MTETKKITYIAKSCPTDSNYYLSNTWTIYDLLRKWEEVEFTPFNIVNIKNGDKVHSVYFWSWTSYNRCKKLFGEWYYKLTPCEKEFLNLK